MSTPQPSTTVDNRKLDIVCLTWKVKQRVTSMNKLCNWLIKTMRDSKSINFLKNESIPITMYFCDGKPNAFMLGRYLGAVSVSP